MTTERISVWQFALLLFVSRSVLAVADMPLLTSGQAGRDGLTAVIAYTLLGVPIVLYFVSLAERHPHQTVFEYANDFYGPWIGRLITVPILWGFLHYAAFTLRQYGEVIVTAVLPQTPLIFIMGCMIFVSAIGVRLGIEALGRSAEILVPLFVVSIASVLLFVLPFAAFERLTPLFAAGAVPVIKGTIIQTSFYYIFLVILVVYPSIREKKRFKIAAVWATLATGLLTTAAVAVTLAVFGPFEVERMRFPLLNLARLIRVAEFIERVEALTLAAWGFGLFLELALIFYVGSRGLGQWFAVKDHRRMVFPMGAILLTLALTLFPNSFQIDDFLQAEVIGPYSFFMMIVIPGILWIGSLLRGPAKGAPHGQNNKETR